MTLQSSGQNRKVNFRCLFGSKEVKNINVYAVSHQEFTDSKSVQVFHNCFGLSPVRDFPILLYPGPSRSQISRILRFLSGTPSLSQSNRSVGPVEQNWAENDHLD